MDGGRFDDAVRAIARRGTRRGVLRGSFGALLGVGVTLFGAGSARAGARRGRISSCFIKGRRCRLDSQCCTLNCRNGECR